MITKELKIIVIEDLVSDKILIERQIKKILSAPKILHLTNFADVKASVELFNPDIIISDYNLPSYSGMDVLNYVNTLKKEIPVIFVTGTIDDEELAAATILTGAHGYLLKKNISTLHKRLLPYFTKIVKGLEKEEITKRHMETFNEIQSILDKAKKENQIIRASYLEMKRTLKTIKRLE